ncbi:hypothetical protein [Pedobacter hartonius]|uniref:Calx-beta domain-containing protein n=1 Tax=Pedobacter hartonius TaxID=425514 RepID=A0A1H4D1Z9_9SPHI|nr:hypothetical protein [Pedobacter hartonius]SEA66459.1 hypothetical protein SAMN05443550_104285 [Pedobacter hartonius]
MKNLFTRKGYTLITLITLASAFLFNSCRNPAYNIDVLFDAAVIKYKATLIVSDAKGATLPTLNLTISGADAASIYDFSGTKAIYAPGGIITLGVNPNAEPTTSKSIKFNVIVKANGYEDINIPMEIVNGQVSQLQEVTLLKSTDNTAASTVVLSTVALNASGTTTAAATIATAANANVATTTSVTIASGTQFKNAAGTVLTGAALGVQLISFDAGDPASLSLFPGGKLSSSNVIMPGSTTPTDAFFIPAASTSIKMTVGNQQVKSFTTPITVTTQLDPAYTMASTGAPVKVGDQLPIYSYQVETGQFTYESTATVFSSGGKLAVNISTSHLTIFVAGEVFATATCSDTKVSYSASWLSTGTRPMDIEISTNSGKIIAKSLVLLSDKLNDLFSGLPGIPLHYKVIDASGETLSTGDLANPCAGNSIIITLTPPSAALENITLQLNIVCPNKGIILVPNFDLYYKPAGAPATAYNILGTASSGLIKTTLLKRGTSYDFKAVWGSQVKIIPNRAITDLDMSTVVGEGLDLGKNPAANNALLIEACKSLN